jgi:uncharacterized membrane protein
MLYIIIFIFGITFTLITGNYFSEKGADLDDAAKESLEASFGTVFQATVSLYMCITGGNDWSQYYDSLLVTGNFGPYLFLLFIFFTQVAVMNIILGMFVNQAIDSTRPTREEAAKEHAEEIRRRDKDLCDIIRSADIAGDGLISIEEWRSTLKKGNLASYLDLCGFRDQDVQEYYEMLCSQASDGKVHLDEFVKGCLQLRGRASRFDMYCLRREVQELGEHITNMLGGTPGDVIAAP